MLLAGDLRRLNQSTFFNKISPTQKRECKSVAITDGELKKCAKVFCPH